MIGLDTNLLLRFTLKDDPAQFELSAKLFKSVLTAKNPGYVSIIVLVEFIWTLRKTFKLSRNNIFDVVAGLLASRNIVFERSSTVAAALELCGQENIEFPDALIAATHREDGCTHTVTFDKAFAASGQAVLLH
jgi:predicted nucleic-acid-binding protein